MPIARENDLVLLIGQDHKQFLLRLEPGGQLQTHHGCVSHDEVLGQPLGRQVQSHLGYPFVVLQPSVSDLIHQLKRNTQIMFPKDIAYVLFRLNVAPGQRVIEAGTGSGGLTLALARALGPSGRVYSYEARPDMLRLAQKNLETAGLAERVDLKLRDIADGFDETEVDALFLDVRYPGLYLSQTLAAVQDSGFFACIQPTTNQVAKTIGDMEATQRFGQIEVEELILRPYKPVPDRLRPMDRMIAHTGYLIFARKVSSEVSQADYWLDRRRRKYEKLHGEPAEAEPGEAGE
jgi:tRNA (adenine57-N1/adenine58-N1)-methyltransferase